ncbi:MAG: carbohydrate ABC transporter substrate-binding protein, partial [Clostridia bacterium]|nr:carbohydrate ABC transporter substrate-binding protein [Clostridia bacterium]
LLFALLASVVLAVSCEGREEESFDVDFQTDFEADLSGMTFTWGSAWSSQMCPAEGFSSDGDKIRAHYREVEKTLQCKINIVQWENSNSRIMQEAAAGVLSLDIIDNETTPGPIALYKANMLVALEDISTIDPYDTKFGPIRFRQYGIFDGKIYGVYQYEWDFPPEFAGALMYNTEMLSSFGLPIPHEMEENGEWTWDNYRQYLRNIADAAQSSGYDRSFVPHVFSNYAYDAFSFMFMNGCQVIEKDSSGNAVFGLDNPKGYEALEYMNGLFSEGLYKQGDTSVMIKDKNAAILTTESYHGTHFHDGYNQNYLPFQDFAYGFTTFPYGPNGDETCVSGFVHIGRRLHYVLRFSPNDKDDIGILFNELFKPIDETGGWRGSLERQVFYDSRDYDMYRHILENVNYNHSFDLDTAYTPLSNALGSAVRGTKTPAEALQSVREAVDEAISEHIIVFPEDFAE